MLLRLTLILAAYLIGSVPFGYLLVKYVFTQGEDVRNVGSGATGATNVARRAGLGAGVLTYLLDMGKGVAAVTLMQLASKEPAWVASAAIAVILGHMFPVFLGFRGGKGVATGVGAFVLLTPYSVFCALIVWAITVYLSRYVSLGSILGAASLPLWTLLFNGLLQTIPETELTTWFAAEVGAAALIIAKHHQNVSRLFNGTENKLGKAASDAHATRGGTVR